MIVSQYSFTYIQILCISRLWYLVLQISFIFGLNIILGKVKKTIFCMIPTIWCEEVGIRRGLVATLTKVYFVPKM